MVYIADANLPNNTQSPKKGTQNAINPSTVIKPRLMIELANSMCCKEALPFFLSSEMRGLISATRRLLVYDP